jgi:hypothetical protein
MLTAASRCRGVMVSHVVCALVMINSPFVLVGQTL